MRIAIKNERQHMTAPPQKSDEAVIAAWQQFAAEQPDFIGAYLRRLREREGITEVEQQRRLGVDNDSFIALQAMPLPRSDAFASDAHRIAEECGLPDPFNFVRIMQTARTIIHSQPSPKHLTAYRAAFTPPPHDLDELPEE